MIGEQAAICLRQRRHLLSTNDSISIMTLVLNTIKHRKYLWGVQQLSRRGDKRKRMLFRLKVHWLRDPDIPSKRPRHKAYFTQPSIRLIYNFIDQKETNIGFNPNSKCAIHSTAS